MDTGYFKSQAKQALQNQWGIFAVGALIYTVLNAIVQIPSLFSELNEFLIQLEYAYGVEVPPILFEISFIFANNPLTMLSGIFDFVICPIVAFGLFSMSYKVINDVKIEATSLFDGFKNFANVWVLNFLQTIFITLWSMLFIIPGIIKGISYSMAGYIMVENPDIKPTVALKESEKLMDGYKGDYFLLQLSFIGWHFLTVFTFGLLDIWLIPYINTTNAAFYERVKLEKYGDDAPYVYKPGYNQYGNSYAPYGQNGAPYAPYGDGYDPYQQNGAPSYATDTNGYAPYQQNGAPYAPDANGYPPYQQNAPYPDQRSSAQYYTPAPDNNPVNVPIQQTAPENNTATAPADTQQTESGTDDNQ